MTRVEIERMISRQVAAQLRPIRDRAQMMFGRGVVAGVNDDTKLQELQIDGLDGETSEAVEHFHGYGFTARPRAEAEVVFAAVGGLRGHMIALAVGDRRYRMTGLAEGEVAIHDDQGQSIHLTRDGIVITSAHGVKVITEGDLELSAEGNISISAEGDLSLGATGAVTIESETLTATTSGAQQLLSDDITVGSGSTHAAARQGDGVNDTTDTISGGSTKVRIA